MTLVTGTVQDLGHDGMDGTLWARPARFRSDGSVVYAPERKPYKVVDGVVSADLAPGPAVLELQVGSHARGTFEVVIPEEDTTLADLLDTVFAWEPAQVSLFVAERKAAELAKTEAEAAAGQAVTAAGTATTAAQQTGQDRSHVDQVRTELDEAFDESTAGNVLPPRLTETALNNTYADKFVVKDAVDDGTVARRVAEPWAQAGTGAPATRRKYRPTSGALATIDTTNTGTVRAVSSLLKEDIQVPPSGSIEFTLSAAAYVSAGGTYYWSLMVNGDAVADTRALVCTAPAGGATETARYTIEGVLYRDGAGQNLVPGTWITVEWGHSCSTGVYGHVVGGEGIGTAVMKLTPASNRLTERSTTATTFGPQTFSPLWMCHDRKTLLGQPHTLARVAWSNDEGTTWTTHPHVFSASVQHVREMDNGEIVVFCMRRLDGTVNASMWVSSGWANDPANATFTMTGEQQGGIQGSWRSWSVDTYGPLVLAAEYGPKNGPDDMARYVYMSEDYGQTWQIIYDLTSLPGFAESDGTGYHMHGVTYDPWWDAIWITSGDYIERCATQVSFDRGKTWRMVTRHHQFTTIYAMPNCILATTDMGNPNGIWRIPRTHPDGPLTGSWAWTTDGHLTGLSVYGNQAFRARDMPDAPLLFSLQSGPTASYSRVVATHDGYNFREVWRDSVQSQNLGVVTMVGPTLSGYYWGRLHRTSAENGDALALRVNATRI